MKSRDFIQMMDAAGWVMDHEGGAHVQYRPGRFQLGVPRHRALGKRVEVTFKSA